MSECKRYASRVLSAEEGATLPGYDLLGQDKAAHGASRELNQQRRLYSQMVAGCFSRLFNGLSCQVEYSVFNSRSLSPLPESERLLWVQADNQFGWQAWLAIEARQLFKLAILFFGGSLRESDGQTLPASLSETEQRLLLRLCQHQLDILCDLLGESELRWTLNLAAEESLPTQGAWLGSEGTLLLGEHDSQFMLWWPMLESDPQASAEGSVEQGLSGRLHAALPAVPVRLRVVLSELGMTLGELQTLQVGDVLALDIPELVPALIGSRACFSGRMAESNGVLVYQVAAVNQI